MLSNSSCHYAVVFNSALGACVKAGEGERAQGVLQLMKSEVGRYQNPC